MSAANHDAGHADDVDGGGQQKRPTLPSLIDSSSGSPGTITGLSTDTFLDWKTQGSSQRAQKISADSGTLSLLGEMLGNRDGERHSGSVRGDRSADSLMSSVTVTERGSDRIFPMVRQDSLFDDGEVDSGIALVDSTSVFSISENSPQFYQQSRDSLASLAESFVCSAQSVCNLQDYEASRHRQQPPMLRVPRVSPPEYYGSPMERSRTPRGTTLAIQQVQETLRRLRDLVLVQRVRQVLDKLGQSRANVVRRLRRNPAVVRVWSWGRQASSASCTTCLEYPHRHQQTDSAEDDRKRFSGRFFRRSEATERLSDDEGRRRSFWPNPLWFFFRSSKEQKQPPSLCDSDSDIGQLSDSMTELRRQSASWSDVEATVLRQRQNALMEHPFFLLEVQLKEGRDLVVRDTCGKKPGPAFRTSDPYVKFKIGGKQVYRSRTVFKNLNPKWDETFTVAVEDVHKPIQLKVFDYDRGLHDDPMGVTEIDCSELELGTATDLKLMLSERGKSDYMGYLLLTCTLIPKTQEDKDQFMRRTVRSTESARKMKIQPWSGVLTIVLVEGEDLMPMDDNGFSDPYVKFRLGNQKYRSKHKSKSLHPKWLEQFDLRLYDDQSSQLEISVYDHDVTGRDDFMGRATVDISKLETEVTHNMEVELEDGAGVLRFLMTISGTCGTEASSDLSHFTPDSSQHLEMAKKYSLIRSFSDLRDVGHLQIKVFKACGLKSMDIGGQSDPFCVLELVNARVQTHTEYKTLNPEWNKVFTFKVRDVHSILEVTVYDEDRDKKAEFLGKVAIPLLRIKTGERRWYALKDKKLMHRTKGAILLEMELFYNNVKAAIRTVNPCEDKFMQVEPKFKIQLLKRNIDRVSQLVTAIMDTARFLRSCFRWDSKPRSITAFIVFLVMVWNFELYMLPITLLIIFMKNLMIAQVLGAVKREPAEDDYFDEDDDDDDEDKDKFLLIFNPIMAVAEEKKSFKEKLQSIQDVCLQVQQAMDTIACIGERIKNTFNWTVPWLTTLAVIALVAGVFVLYLIPLRYLILAWGINKFTKKLRSPNAVNNNELLDFLSRVPSDDELILYRELRPELTPTPGKKKRA